MKKEEEKFFLEKVLKTEQEVASIASGEIIFSPALIIQNTIPIIRRGTINIIQGRQGSHKSRLAELICSMMVREKNNPQFSIGFERNPDEQFTVCYVDTERNKNEELPASIQRIVRNADCKVPANVPEFRFTSLKDIRRDKRLETLKLFLDSIRKTSTNPLFVILDVVTDCIANFNDPVESMLLLDYIGNLTETCNATFLLVIHENPGGDKARGHLGTEAINKASTVMRIGCKSVADPNSLTVEFVKTRHSGTIPNIPVQFCETTKSLRIREFSNTPSAGKPMVSVDGLGTKLGEYLSEAREGKMLFDIIKKDFQGSENTIKTRLSEISNSGMKIVDTQNRPTTLLISANSGKKTMYELVEIVVEHL